MPLQTTSCFGNTSNKLRYQKDVFKNFFQGAILSGGAFIIRDNATNEVVGSSRYYDYDLENKSILIGYTFVGRKFWEKAITNL